MRPVVRIVAVALLATTLACSPNQTERPALAFILAGQSNMVGRGTLTDLASDLRTVPTTIVFLRHRATAEFADQRWFGPEVGFAQEMAAAWPGERILLLKRAVDGTSLLAWAPDWDAIRADQTDNRKAGPLYRTLMGDVADASRRYPLVWAGLVWMQGESDALHPTAGEEYGSNLATFVGRLRHDLGRPKLPFIYGQINPPRDFPARERVRAAQVAAETALSPARMVITDDLPMGADHLHYNSVALVELGRRLARAYLALQPRPPAASH